MGHRAEDISLHPPGHQRNGDDGNGSGVEVRTKLNGKQVSLIIGAALSLSTGGAWLTSRPVRGVEAAVTVKTVEEALDSSPKYQLDKRRVDELAKTVETMSDRVKFLYDEALKRQGAQEERQRRRKETQ